MRDRFPLLLIIGFALLGVLGASVLRGSSRGDFAGPLSTYRSEAQGARALFLLAEESGLSVRREKRDLAILDEGTSHVLLGISAGYKLADDEPKKEEATGDADAGTAADGGTTRASDDDVDEDALPFFLSRGEVLSNHEREKLLEHVKAGHTLVYVPPDSDEDALLREVGLRPHAAPENQQPKLRTLVPAQPSPFTLGVERVEAEVKTYWSSNRTAVLPLLREAGDGGGAVAALAPYGAGRVIVIGAPELATNPALARADNARLWLSLLSAAAGRDALLFDEHHHGFREDRSVAAFAARYGLHLAVAQLLLGLCLWAASLRRFGRPRAPLAEARVGGVDVLFAAGRLYRAGKHHGHAAKLLADGLALDLAPTAGVPLHAKPEEIEAALRARGRAELAAGLAEVGQRARAASSEHDVLETARTAARVRLLLQPRRSARRANAPHPSPQGFPRR